MAQLRICQWVKPAATPYPSKTKLMSNKASDQLHRLIHSMSKPEKRYFKVHSSRNSPEEENNYQVLFDAIDRQVEYNEEKLLKKFAEKAFVHRFSISKNRLYNAILRSLDAFHISGSTEAQLHRQIHSASILYNKSLYDQSLKILEGAKKIATRHELLPILCEIHHWEKRILEKNQYEDIEDSSQLETIVIKDRELIQELSAIDELWHIKSQVFHLLYRQGKARNAQETAAFKSIIDQTVKQASSLAKGTEATYLQNHIYSAYHFGLGEYDKCYPYLSKNLELIEANPLFFTNEPSTWLSVLTNAMYVGMRLGKWKESFRLMDKLRAYRDQPELIQNEDVQVRLFGIGCSAELALFAQSGEFEMGVALVPAIEVGLKKYEGLLSSVRIAHFCFNTAVCYFGLGRYQESMKWLNRLLNEIPIDKTRDLHCMAQVLSLVVHMELGNDRLLPYSLRSTQRFLETRRKVYGVEEILLRFVGDSLKKRQGSSAVARYQQLADELAPLKIDSYERNAFEFFDFHAWAVSKSTGKKYRELLAA